ncbi:hypothetical protein [Pararhizobium haloflavum]|uniref:hypothetical protein n=1 Tax=Pararhizobium haloflavum TaxID=2037914 RepID=UPI000C19EC09|nr:hypothetical protein [Pararhizobium haloflavum]
MSRSRGADPTSLIRHRYPYRVRVEAALIAGTDVSIVAGCRTVYRFAERMQIEGVEWLVYRFADRAEAERCAGRTIGVLMDGTGA